jgi:hypothetical protein
MPVALGERAPGEFLERIGQEAIDDRSKEGGINRRVELVGEPPDYRYPGRARVLNDQSIECDGSCGPPQMVETLGPV